MDFNRIDLSGIRPGWGSIWQGGSPDAAVEQLPGPLLIVCMDRGEFNEQFVDHQNVQAVLAVWIDDAPDAVLPDHTLISLVDTVEGWLRDDCNVYDHCAAGVSRASYMDIAIHMRAGDLSFDDAFALVHSQRPVANPNAGFVAQLRRLESELRAA
jgi:protein-tyrosine phosphatase